MKRSQMIVAGSGLVVLVGLVVLYFATRSPDAAPAAAPTVRAGTDTGPASASTSHRTPPPRVERESPASDDRPARDGTARSEYIDNSGRMVRDHRRGAPAPLMDTQTEPRHAPIKVDPRLIGAISQQVRPIVRRCSAEVPEGRFGPDAQVQARLRVSIAAGVVSVDEVRVTLNEGEDADLVSCIRDGAAALSMTAEGHPDVAEKWLTFPYRLRRP